MRSMRSEVGATPEAAGALGAALIRGWSAEAIAARGEFTIALAGGEGPRVLYEALARDPSIDFARWRVLWGDEQDKLPRATRSNAASARKWLRMDRASVPAERVHPMVVDGGDPAALAEAYEALLARVLGDGGALDCVLLGVGKDAHTLSLPGGLPGDRRAGAAGGGAARSADGSGRRSGDLHAGRGDRGEARDGGRARGEQARAVARGAGGAGRDPDGGSVAAGARRARRGGDLDGRCRPRRLTRPRSSGCGTSTRRSWRCGGRTRRRARWRRARRCGRWRGSLQMRELDRMPFERARAAGGGAAVAHGAGLRGPDDRVARGAAGGARGAAGGGGSRGPFIRTKTAVGAGVGGGGGALRDHGGGDARDALRVSESGALRRGWWSTVSSPRG